MVNLKRISKPWSCLVLLLEISVSAVHLDENGFWIKLSCFKYNALFLFFGLAKVQNILIKKSRKHPQGNLRLMRSM